MGPPGKVCPGLPSESDVVVEGDYCGAQVYESTEEDPSWRDHLASKCQLADEREQATLCACRFPRRSKMALRISVFRSAVMEACMEVVSRRMPRNVREV